MFRQLTICAAIAWLLLAPAIALAGGPPRLCIPIDGATTANAHSCGKLVTAALGKGVMNVDMRQNDGQWYLLLNFNRDKVRLNEIDAALKGSPFSVPRDKMRVFADAVVEIDLRSANADKLIADLKALDHVTVGETKKVGGVLTVALAAPAPTYRERDTEFGAVAFHKESFRAEAPNAPETSLKELPTYTALTKVVEKHQAKVANFGWDLLGCRVMGCVVGPGSTTKVTARAN